MDGQEKEIMTKIEKRNLVRGFLTVLILICIYAGILVWQRIAETKMNRKAAEDAEEKVLLALEPDQIKSISFGEDPKVNLEKTETGYGSPDDPDFIASSKRTLQMEKDLSDLEMSRKLSDSENLEKYGLEAPLLEIDVSMEDGDTHRIKVGNHSDSRKELYILVDDDPSVYLTGTPLDEHFSGDLNALAEYEAFPEIIPEKIREIEVQKEEDSFLMVTPGDDTCTVTDENDNTQSADVSLAGTIQMNLSNLSWLNNTEYHCTEPEKYGLEKPTAEIRIGSEDGSGKTTDGEETALSEVCIIIGNKDESGNYYAGLQGSSQVHTIRGEYLESLVEGKAEDFWSLNYSFVSISDLEDLEVTIDKETHVLRAVSENGLYTDEDMTWYVDETEVSKDLFTDFYYACVSVTAQERMAEVPEYKEAPALSLHYHLKDGTEKQMDYYAEDQNFYTVIYENGSKAAKTNRVYVNAMIEKGKALFQMAESGAINDKKGDSDEILTGN